MLNGNRPTTVVDYPDVSFVVAGDQDVGFVSMDWPTDDQGTRIPIIWGLSSDQDFYIKPNADGSPHVLPAHAAIPVVHYSARWENPSEEKIALLRQLVLSTSPIGQLGDPEWLRIQHFIQLLKDDQLPPNTPMNSTDQGWQQRYFHLTFGGAPHVGWYHGVNFRSGANGYDNYHYDRLFWMMVRFIFDYNPQRRAQLWPYLGQSIFAHLCHGRMWGGPEKGAARAEKGTTYVGDLGTFSSAKQWIMNVLVGYLMFDKHPAFEDMARSAYAWWGKKPASEVWKGYWGTRQAARYIEDHILLGLVFPDLRAGCVSRIQDMMHQLNILLNRQVWVWPNLGNGGTANESPWMDAQCVTACLKAWQFFPETVNYGPTREELINVMKTIFSDYGSEEINGYRVLRYGYHTNQDQARYIANTAPALPALYRLAPHSSWAAAQHRETRELIQQWAGTSVTNLRANNPTDLFSIGFRFPPEGGGWSKTLLIFCGAAL